MRSILMFIRDLFISWLIPPTDERKHVVYFMSFLIIAAIVTVLMIVLRFISGKILMKREQNLLVKYFRRFLWQITVVIVLFTLLLPLYCAGGFSQNLDDIPGAFPSIIYALYHSIRFFVIEGDLKETIQAIAFCQENYSIGNVIQYFYYIAIGAGFFIAPFFTITAIMSVFRNIRGRFQYSTRMGDVHVFSELNEKSFALADSILRTKQHAFKPVIVFTDVLEPDNEVQFDLQERAEQRGCICFRNDLESINYRFCIRRNKKKYTFYLINDDESEKIRHTSFISKKYDIDDVNVYVFSDKTSSKLFLSVADQFKRANIIRIDEIQSLIYYNLHENGVRLFETAKKCHESNAVNKEGKIVIRAIIIGFGRYGREMFKALLWFCQMPGYELELHVMDNTKKLKSRLLQDFPELMEKRKNAEEHDPKMCRGDAQYSIFASDTKIDVNTNKFTEVLREIQNPTYVFVALGNDEENIRTSIKVRELYQKMGYEPDIETVVYDTNMADGMSFRWPLAGCLDAARLIFQDGFFNSGYRSSFSHLYCSLSEYFKANLSVHTDHANEVALRNLMKIVEWGYEIDIQKLYDRDDYLEKRHNPQYTFEEYQSEIITEIPPRICDGTNSSSLGDTTVLHENCCATVVERNNTVQIRVRFCFYSVEDQVSAGSVKGSILSAFDKADKELLNRKNGVSNFKKQPYKIHMIGDMQNFYRHEIIINNNLIEKGRVVDERWNKTNRLNSKLAISIFERLAELAENGTIFPRRYQKTCEIFVLKLKTGMLCEGDGYTIKDLLFKFTDGDLKKKLHAYTVRTDDCENLLVTDSEGKEVDDNLKNEMILCLFNQFRSDCCNMRDDALNSRIGDIEKGFGVTDIATYISTKIHPFVAEFIRKMDSVTAIRNKYNNRIMVLVNDEINNSFDDFSFPYCRDGLVCSQNKCARCRNIPNGPYFNGNCQNQWEDLCNSIENIHRIGERDGMSHTVADIYANCDSCLYKKKCTRYNDRLLRILAGSPILKKCCVKLRRKLLTNVHKKCTCTLSVLEELISSTKTQKAVCLSCDQCASQCIAYQRLKCMLESMQIYSSRNYYKFEYNQRASITKYMHETLRFRLLRCGYIDDELRTAFSDENFYVFEQLRNEKPGERSHKMFVRYMISAIEKDPITVTTLEEQLVIGSLEHIRWNAYMRTEGYSFSIKRNDMAKQHNLLLPLHHMYLSDIRKDV